MSRSMETYMGRSFRPVMKLEGLTKVFRILIVVSAVLAFWGWLVYEDITDPGSAVWSAAYRTLQTYIFEVDFDEFPVPIPLMIAVFIAPLSLAGSIVIYFLRLTSNRLQARIVGWTYRNHYVVFGDTPESRVLVESHDKEGSTKIVFVVPPESEIPDEVARHGNVVVIRSTYTSAEIMAATRMDRAHAVFVFPSSEEAIEDYARAIVTAVREGKYRSHTKEVRASFAIRAGAMDEVFSTFSKILSRSYAGHVTGIEFNTFSLDARIARELVEKIAPHVTMDRDTLSCEPIELVIHGFSSFIERYIIEAAQLYHYSIECPFKISVVTDKVHDYNRFIDRYPGLSEVVSIQRFAEGNLSTWVRQRASAPFYASAFRVVVWSDDIWEIPRLARNWRRAMLPVPNSGTAEVPVTFILPYEERMTEVFSALSESLEPLNVELLALRDLLKLPLLVQDIENIDAIARQIHEGYRQKYGAEPWETLSDWQRSFNRRSAAHLKIKLWFLGYRFSGDTDSSPGSATLPDISESERSFLAKIEHRRWVSEKLLDDFVPGQFPKDGSEKRYKEHLRIHEKIQPFSELSSFDKKKDEETFSDLKFILEQILQKERLIKTDS